MTKQQAIQEYAKMRKQLDGRWRRVLYGTPGGYDWSFRAVRGALEVTDAHCNSGYECNINPPTWITGGGYNMGVSISGPRRTKPMDAVLAALKKYRKEVAKQTKCLMALVDSLGGGV